MSGAVFQEGDLCLSLKHGVGKVQSIKTRSLGGPSESSYAELYFSSQDLTLILLEKDLPETVRELVPAEKADELIACLEDWDGEPNKAWKARALGHQAAIEGGDPFENVKTFKELYGLSLVGVLRTSDRQNYNKSLELLIEELMYSLGKPQRRVRKLIMDALGASEL